jgi:hypothetical protein
MFYVTTIYYEPGDTIHAGGLGRTLGQYGQSATLVVHNQTRTLFGKKARLDLERDFEMVRREQFPELPSRLTCSFAFTDIQTAKSNCHQVLLPNSPFQPRIYRVEPKEGICTTHIADMSLIPAPPGLTNIQAAEKYWQGSATMTTKEVLLSSSLRVLSLIEGQTPAFTP